MERTLAIIKPDAVDRRIVGRILQRIEDEGLDIRGMRKTRLTRADAAGFYDVHRGRAFFDALTAFMSSGPVVVLALDGEDAIGRWREIMGATDPARAEPGTIRREFGESIERNAVHGSDAVGTAAFEVAYFFSGLALAR